MYGHALRLQAWSKRFAPKGAKTALPSNRQIQNSHRLSKHPAHLLGERNI